MGVAAAIAGAAVVGAGATAYAGSKAASAQKKAAKRASQTEMAQFEQTRADQAPWRETGTQALYKLADMYGVSRPTGMTTTPMQPTTGVPSGIPAGMLAQDPRFAGYTQPGMQTGQIAPAEQAMTPGYGGFQESPGYAFRRDEALKAIERMGSARGARFSPQTWKAGARYADNLASAEFENYANALRSMAGIGQTSANLTAQLGAQTASNIAGNQLAAGQARASSIANTGAAIGNLGNNLAYGYMSGMFGGGGGLPPFNPTGSPTMAPGGAVTVTGGQPFGFI